MRNEDEAIKLKKQEILEQRKNDSNKSNSNTVTLVIVSLFLFIMLIIAVIVFVKEVLPLPSLILK